MTALIDLDAIDHAHGQQIAAGFRVQHGPQPVANTIMQVGHVRVQMTTTTRGCPLADFLRLGVEAALQSLDGVMSVDVQLVWEPAWSPDRMEPL